MIRRATLPSFVVCFFLVLVFGLGLGAPARPAAAEDPAVAEPPVAQEPPVAEEPSAAELARGEIVDPVVCTADPEFSYALYLPTSYTPDRAWPALFILDARGRGAMVVEIFRAAAERYGWVLVSSNDSASDATWDEIQLPATAILRDAPRRVRVDPQRVYLAGFSGTAIGVVALAANAAGGIAGTIAVGAGFPSRLEPSTDLTFSHFGAAGHRDFNMPEMRELWEALDEAGMAHRFAVFEGGHQWPAAPVAEEALSWLEVDAMRRGLRPVDTELALAWAREDERRWQSVEPEDPWAAWTGWRSLAASLEGLAAEGPADQSLREIRERASAEAERLAGSKAFERQRVEREKIARWEADRREEAGRILGAITNFELLPPPETRTQGERLIRSLLKTIERDGATAKADAAFRVLTAFGANLSFYVPRELMPRGEYQRALLSLELATTALPDNLRAWYDLGCARARLGQSAAALDALARAVELGYRNADYLRSDPDLESLREDDRFRQLASQIEERQAVAAPGS